MKRQLRAVDYPEAGGDAFMPSVQAAGPVASPLPMNPASTVHKPARVLKPYDDLTRKQKATAKAAGFTRKKYPHSYWKWVFEGDVCVGVQDNGETLAGFFSIASEPAKSKLLLTPSLRFNPGKR